MVKKAEQGQPVDERLMPSVGGGTFSQVSAC